VSANPIPRLFTVEEYEQIPDPPGGRYELHHGELVFVTYPVREHGDLQRGLQEILAPAGRRLGYLVAIEYPYRPLPESEVWGADVACIALPRHQAVEKWLLGCPELVIEVKSPSNTKHELGEKAMITLAGEGAVEFWIVDPKTRSVLVYNKTDGTRLYRAPESVPVTFLNCEVSLETLFDDL
jgi:Uma2 family endonuclease